MTTPQFVTTKDLTAFLQAGNVLSLVRENDFRNLYLFWDDSMGQMGYFIDGVECVFGLSSILTDKDIVKNIAEGNYTVTTKPANAPTRWNSLYKEDLLIDALAQKVEQNNSLYINAHFPLGLSIFYAFRMDNDGGWTLNAGDSEYTHADRAEYDSVFEMWLSLIQAVECPNSSITFEESELDELTDTESDDVNDSVPPRPFTSYQDFLYGLQNTIKK